ncbi:MAG TPA: isochorismatase family cysteine hydrolase [Puia sp.]|nr:isochorismatase family cysteine hydrolase [Puia sp.]
MEQKKALLVMDVQNGIVKNLPNSTPVVAAVFRAIQSARKNNIPVIYVVTVFRKGYPEVSINNKLFSTIRSSGRNLDQAESAQVVEAVAPLEGDVLVAKKRISAFAGSDLEIVLRAMDIRKIVLAGISTSGVVLSTVREAADKDYAITVLADACGDADEEVHRVLTTKIFPRQAEVIMVDDWRIAD